MILRRIIAACALLCAFASGAAAQTGRVLTPTQLNAEIYLLFADQTNGAITPFQLRQVELDLVASLGIAATASPLTVTPDTNITATLSGVPATALLQSVGISFGWLGQLAVSRGGTGQASFTANLPLIGNGTGAVGQGTRSGNTTVFGTVSGVFTPGDCIKVDASGNLIDNGATCGAGSNTAATQNFLAGTDFTPGTTTSLTLSSSPTNANQLFIAFDGAVQSHDTWTLAGAVATFSVAIPANVNVVEAQWYTASTTAGVGSLTDSAGNVASGAVTLAPPLAVSSNTVTTGGACLVQSRAAALLVNLSLCNVVQTGGYANPGDGGGATFVKSAAAGFKDSTILTGTISNAGSGCTNATYLGMPLSSGYGVSALVNVTVSGNIVSAVAGYNPNGNAYVVGDVLGIPSSIGCSGATWTVATVSTATGSFTDNVGTKFQIETDAGNFPNVRQFGAKVNWANSTGDAGATDDSAAFKSGLIFAYYGLLSIGNGGTSGGVLQMPSQTALVCSTLTIPVGVTLNATGPFAGAIKQCDSSTATAVNLGDPNSGIACFAPKLSNIEIFMGSGTPASGIAAIFTNCAQQQIAIDNVTVYAVKYECLRAITGLGGAASLTINGLFCTLNSTSVDGIGIFLGYGAAITTLTNTIVESGNAFTGSGVVIPASAGGVFRIHGFHEEQVATGILWSATGSGALLDIQDATGGAGPNCGSMVTRQNTAVANQVRMSMIFPNGCTATYNNAGTTHTGNITTETFM